MKNVKLFNLKEDIGERTDLCAKEPDRVKELRAIWEKWSAEQTKPALGQSDPAGKRPERAPDPLAGDRRG